MARKKKNIHLKYIVEDSIEDLLSMVSSQYLSDAEWDKLAKSIDPLDPASLQKLFRGNVLERYTIYPEKQRRECKVSIEYILSQEEDVPEKYIISGHMGFPFGNDEYHFKNQKLFFSVLYEVLFGKKLTFPSTVL